MFGLQLKRCGRASTGGFWIKPFTRILLTQSRCLSTAHEVTLPFNHSGRHAACLSTAHAVTHTIILIIQNFVYSHLKQQSGIWFGGRQQRGSENMTGLLSLKKRSLKVWLEESRKSFRRRGRWRSFHVKRPETEKAREPIAENLVGRIWSFRSRAESTGRCVKL